MRITEPKYTLSNVPHSFSKVRHPYEELTGTMTTTARLSRMTTSASSGVSLNHSDLDLHQKICMKIVLLRGPRGKLIQLEFAQSNFFSVTTHTTQTAHT